jgi:hypothetical protein
MQDYIILLISRKLSISGELLTVNTIQGEYLKNNFADRVVGFFPSYSDI